MDLHQPYMYKEKDQNETHTVRITDHLSLLATKAGAVAPEACEADVGARTLRGRSTSTRSPLLDSSTQSALLTDLVAQFLSSGSPCDVELDFMS